MSELEKMKLGMWYDANFDENLVGMRMDTQDLCRIYNNTSLKEPEKQREVLKTILGEVSEGLTVIPTFMCDYGKNIHLGTGVFINAHCYFMDGAEITLGNNVFVGPYCGFYTATHPLDYKRRNAGLEKALPIKVGDNCWFGANVSVMPGVTIGNGCVIAAGSVVTKDIPENSMVAGVPAKVVKTIDQEAE